MVQELEFHAGQVQRLVVQRDFQGLGIHAQPVHTEHSVLPVRAFRKPGVFHAPQDNPDAGEQFPRGEGFRHIVVRAELKGDDAVRLLVVGGQDDDRRARFRAQVPQHLNPRNIRQQHVQQDDVVFLTSGGLDPRRPRVHGGNGERVHVEVIRHQLAKFAVVIDEQHLMPLSRITIHVPAPSDVQPPPALAGAVPGCPRAGRLVQSGAFSCYRAFLQRLSIFPGGCPLKREPGTRGNTFLPIPPETRCLPALSGARSAPRNAPAAFPKRRPQARAPRSRPGGTGWSWARAFPSGL